MKKSCGLSAAVWIVFMGVYGWLAWTKTHETAPAAIVGVLGGTFAAMLAGSAWGLVSGTTDRAALKRAIAGTPPKDDRLEAATGRVHALGAPLESPFTGRACVAYQYDVKNPGAQRSDFTGVALVPCAVETSRGSVRLLGWSMLDEFPAALQEEIDRPRGLAYLQGAPFERLGFTNVLSFLSGLVADQDGKIRKDMRIADSRPHLDGRRIEEKVVPEGSTVTVLGIWSEENRGFAPRSSAMLNRLYPVSPSFILEDVRKGAWKTFGIAVVFFAALHAILVPMWLLAPNR